MNPLNRVKKILVSGFNEELAEAALDEYAEMKANYVTGNWAPSQIGAGRFVEIVRRMLELKLFGTYPSFGSQLTNFHPGELSRYAKQSNKHDSYRLRIPRVLWSINDVRNNRGAAHVSAVTVNEMDSRLVVRSIEWVLAELVRLNSTLNPTETDKLIRRIVEREVELLWKRGGTERILDTSLSAKQEVLVLLYDQDPRSDEELLDTIEYSNASVFRDQLDDLHDDRLIDYDSSGHCRITPTGEVRAEEIIEHSRLFN